MNRNVRHMTALGAAAMLAAGAAAPAASQGRGARVPLATGAPTPATAKAKTPRSEPTSPSVGGACPGASLQPSRHDLTAVDDATICLINRAREQHHLSQLTANEELDRAAAVHSHEMRVDRFFGHVTPSGEALRTQVLASGYGAHASDVAAGQCVAWGSGSYATPRRTVRAWMASPSHRKLLLAPTYREVGIGASRGNDKGGSSGAL
ncbi:MAG: CAP domain-containing protein, partial [Solirubrobacteraceae bacterium]